MIACTALRTNLTIRELGALFLASKSQVHRILGNLIPRLAHLSGPERPGRAGDAQAPRPAFRAFFRRLRDTEAPGFTRWGYKKQGDGWRLAPGEGRRHGHLYMTGMGLLKMRGKPRKDGEPKTGIVHRRRCWYASVTVECTPMRCRGQQGAGFDWDVETLATLATEAGQTVCVENARHLKNSLSATT